MTVHLVTFATDDCLRSANLCIESAKQNGVDGTTITQPGEKPEGPFTERGFGHWRWKPSVILNRMNLPEGNFLPVLEDGNILIYSDAGIEFINNVSHIIDRMDQDIFLFGNNWEHAHWCKRDVIEAVWPWWDRGRPSIYQGDEVGDRAVNVFVGSEPRARDITICELAWERFHKQVQASVIFFRVSDYTRAFVKEWLDWCLFEGGRLIDDSPSRLPNHPEFREHRHDQSILTTLAYREGIKLHWWGARYNMDQPGGGFVYPKAPEFAGDNYEPFVHHHRRRNHEWSEAA